MANNKELIKSSKQIIILLKQLCAGSPDFSPVLDLVELLTEHWDLLPMDYQRQMHRDIKDAMEFNRLGDECDITRWKSILELKVKSDD